jgi:hypothetical protein
MSVLRADVELRMYCSFKWVWCVRARVCGYVYVYLCVCVCVCVCVRLCMGELGI